MSAQPTELRALLAKQGWAKDWAFDIVPPGKPAHELACKAVRALPALLDKIERLEAALVNVGEVGDFLCDRLDEIDGASGDPKEFVREFYGHIPAPLSRLRTAIYEARKSRLALKEQP